MNKLTWKRVAAYIADWLIVGIIAALFGRVQVLNPHYDEYLDEYESYTETLKNSMTDASLKEELTELTYNVSKASVNLVIINLVVGTVYFVGFQFLNKGQTLGKKLLKIKMVTTEEGSSLKIYQVLLNAIIINNLLTTTLSILAISFLSKAAYIKYSSGIEMLELAFLLGSLACMIIRNDGRGLHDLLANTKVVKESEA